MKRINLVRSNLVRNNGFRNNSATLESVAWGTRKFEKTAGTIVFAGLLIVCSVAVGCSSDNPKVASSGNQSSINQNAMPQTVASSSVPAPVAAEIKPVPKKIVKKRPATVTYVNKSYGVAFEYPRRYAIETGDAAGELLASSVLPMNFVLPGGTALAAVELPETGFANTDFSSAFFNVSVNKAVTAEGCGKFSVPLAATSTQEKTSEQAKTETAKETGNGGPIEAKSETTSASPVAATSAPDVAAASKLMLGDMEMQRAEAVAGDGNRQSDSKYFHVYQNGACYEFALNVTTVAAQNDGGMKHVDRDKVFERLERILATVKIEAPAEVTASAPAEVSPTTAAATPAQ